MAFQNLRYCMRLAEKARWLTHENLNAGKEDNFS